jgi:hypothetical protein
MQAVFSDSQMEQYKLAHSHFVISSITRVIQFYLFFLGPVLTLPFLVVTAGGGRRMPNVRLLLWVFLISALGLLLPTYYGPTYSAPLTCVIYVLLLSAMRSVRRWRWHGKSTGLAIVRATPAICLLMLLIRAIAPLPGLRLPEAVPITWCSPHLLKEYSRERTQAMLESQPGLQLALVRYAQEKLEPVDWVQNLADIDHQKIVWANDMGSQQNQELIDYFKDRRVWLVEPANTPPQISSYPTLPQVETTRP